MQPLLATLPKALQQRPVVVLLAAKYCGECQTLKPVLEKVAQQHSKNPSGVLLLVLEVPPPYGEAHQRLPLAQAKALVELLNPAVTPTLLRFSATGQLQQVQVGQQAEAALHPLFSAGQQGA
jgi:thiol-disulfide isomerase/thioredoxin